MPSLLQNICADRSHRLRETNGHSFILQPFISASISLVQLQSLFKACSLCILGLTQLCVSLTQEKTFIFSLLSKSPKYKVNDL